MKMTKVIRNYVEKTLTEKRLAKNSLESASYNARRNACIEELEVLVKETRNKAKAILAEYEMDTEKDRYGNSITNRLIRFDTGSVTDSEERAILDASAEARYKKQKEVIDNIELEMALGGQKAELMKMLEEVNFD